MTEPGRLDELSEIIKHDIYNRLDISINAVMEYNRLVEAYYSDEDKEL